MSRGYVPSVPVDQVSYDLIVDSDDGLKRVQIKTTTQMDKSGHWNAQTHKRIYDKTRTLNASGKRRKVPYEPDEVDIFFIMTGDRSVYIVPYAVVGTKKHLSLGPNYDQYKLGA